MAGLGWGELLIILVIIVAVLSVLKLFFGRRRP
jgi:Sec-independent protein translocase protein TatA